MGGYGMGALRGLSNYITLKAEQAHERQNQLDDEERKNQVATLNAAITSGNLNPDQIQSAIDQMKGLYPKQTHGLLDKFGEVVGHITNMRNKQAAQAPAAPATNPTTGAPAVAPPAQSSVDTLNNNNAAAPQTPTPGAPMPPPKSSVDFLNSQNGGTPSSPVPNPAATAVSTPPPAAPGVDKNVAGLATAQLSGTAAPAPNAPAVPPSMANILSSAFPNPVAKATTNAQATVAGNDVLQADRNNKADQLISDLKASGSWTPQAETAIRMQAQGFTVPTNLMRPTMGKEMVPDVQAGVLMGVKDPITNQFYTDPKTMPAEAKAVWDQATTALKNKSDADEAKQNRTFEHQMAMQQQSFINALNNKDYTAATKAVNDAQGLVNDAKNRMTTMDHNLVDFVQSVQDGHPNQQAALSLVANHIGMTLGGQKGARITRAAWDEAQDSAPWLQKVGAKFSSDGYLSGVTITIPQAKQMVELAHQRVQTLSDSAQRIKDDNATTLQLNPRNTSAVPPKLKKPSGKSGGKIVVTPEDMANAGR